MKNHPSRVYSFIVESNAIEGINREPSVAEIAEFQRFYELETPTIADLEKFVSIYQPGAILRSQSGLDVRIGKHIPPPGGPQIHRRLDEILKAASLGASPYKVHCEYEMLHPFTDGNGRSGRMLWAWAVHDLTLGFLHRFYYQTLAAYGDRYQQHDYYAV